MVSFIFCLSANPVYEFVSWILNWPLIFWDIWYLIHKDLLYYHIISNAFRRMFLLNKSMGEKRSRMATSGEGRIFLHFSIKKIKKKFFFNVYF